MAQCHMELEQWDRALFFYEGFLREDPTTSNRDLVEERIGEAKRWRGLRRLRPTHR